MLGLRRYMNIHAVASEKRLGGPGLIQTELGGRKVQNEFGPEDTYSRTTAHRWNRSCCSHLRERKNATQVIHFTLQWS